MGSTRFEIVNESDKGNIVKNKITLLILSSLVSLPLFGGRSSESYTIGAEGLLPQTSFADGGLVLNGTMAPFGGGSSESYMVLAGVNPASNTLISLPRLEAHPENQDLLEGETLTLEVAVSGPGPFSYSWMKDGVAISEDPILEIEGVINDDEGEYSVAVSNSFGEVNSLTASLSVLAKPVILAQPADVVGNPGGSISLAVDARVEGTPVFTWYKDGTEITGANANILLLADLGLEDTGVYAVEISNEAGSVLSDDASLTLEGGPTNVPSALVGSEVVAIGEGTVTYMSSWFGEFTVQDDSEFGWIWTDSLGWTFFTSISTPQASYIYPLLVGGIIYTAEGLYPEWGYSYSDANWVYFYSGNDASTGTIWAYSYAVGDWVSYSE